MGGAEREVIIIGPGSDERRITDSLEQGIKFTTLGILLQKSNSSWFC